MGGRHDARVGEQWPIGGVGLGQEHVEPEAGEVAGVEVREGGLGVDEAAAGDVDEPGACAPRSEYGVVDEGRLSSLIPAAMMTESRSATQSRRRSAM